MRFRLDRSAVERVISAKQPGTGIKDVRAVHARAMDPAADLALPIHLYILESPEESLDSSMQALFRDRREAGRLLAEMVASSVRGEDVLVLGLPRGGVEVAYEVARVLGAPLDVFVTRTLELPGEHVAIGSIAAGGVRVLDTAMLAALEIPQGVVDELARREALKLARIERHFRGHRQGPRMMGRTIVLVDDGLSEPSHLRAAVEALRVYRPMRVVVGLPAASADLSADLRKRAGEVLSVVPSDTSSRGGFSYYEDHGEISDRDVRHLLARSASSHGGDHRLAG